MITKEMIDPVRGKNESYEDYCVRRNASNRFLKERLKMRKRIHKHNLYKFVDPKTNFDHVRFEGIQYINPKEDNENFD